MSQNYSAAAPVTGPAAPPRPRLLNGTTTHGLFGIRALRHPKELPLLWLAVAANIVCIVLWFAYVVRTQAVPDPSEAESQVRDFLVSSLGQIAVFAPLAPIIVWVVRARDYAKLRAQGVQMSPTQFPEGYRMLVEAAHAFGLRKVPDAYVVLGNGTINAFAEGHGFRRFVAVNSDLFEVGGAARDPEALRFVISHEVGHIAAGHTGYFRIAFTFVASKIPILGKALSRAQEYTADNHGYALAPQGAAGCMGLLAAGKYLGAQVNFHALADRATREKGFWLHIASWTATHPVTTWRTHALRDRSRPGRIMIRPKENTAMYPPVSPVGYDRSRTWPSPAQVLATLSSTAPRVREEQFGRYPGITYETPRDVLRLSDPTPVPVTMPPQAQPE